MKLEGNVAIVTGGARGMGRSHCLALAKEGADIVTCDISEKNCSTNSPPIERNRQLDRTVIEVKSLGRKCFGKIADISREDQVKALVEKTVEEFGRVDILVNNAAVDFLYGPCQEVSEEDWNIMMDVNLKGPWLCCKHVIPYMIREGKGKIINISSVCGLSGLANTVPYSCSKHGVIGLTRSLAAELAPNKINVNAVCPGPVDTPMLAESCELAGITKKEIEEASIFPTLFGRVWRPEDISNAVVWLASEESCFLTGHAIPADGGWIGPLP